MVDLVAQPADLDVRGVITMARYQNIFTQVQLRGHPELGMPHKDDSEPRIHLTTFSYWMGKLGQAQLGPLYLGKLGLASLLFGALSISIMGLNMLASVNWNPNRFLKEFFWLALEPPGPEWGFSVYVPLAEGGWWIIAGFFLTASILLWWARTYLRAKALGMGTHIAWAFCERDLAVSGAGHHPPVPARQLVGSGALRHLPASRLDGRLLDPLRQPVLQSVPRAFDRLPLWLHLAFRHAWRHNSGCGSLWWRARDRADLRSRHCQ
jgi:hypothetical protein